LGIKPRHTWKEAVLRFLAETEHKKSRRGDIASLRWADSHFGALHLDEISRDRIDRLMTARKAEKVSNASVNRMLAVVRSVLRKAANEWEWIDRSPKVRLLPEPKLRVRYLSSVEALELLRHLPSHLAAMAQFSLLTGLRQGNVRGLRWSQVDLEGRKLWINADQAKGGRAIAVPLPPEAASVLSKQRGQHSEWVFTFRGKPITQVNTKAWREALKRAGITDFRWHDLRHTWASWHAQGGTPQSVLQELGGWESASMVRRYAHFSPEHLRGYADGFGERVRLQ